MLNAASWHYTQRDPRVQLSFSHVCTLNDPRYRSLYPTYSQPPSRRRLTNISDDDLHTFKREIEVAVKDWRLEGGSLSGPNYGGLIDAIVDKTATRFSQMRTYLASSDTDLSYNTTKVTVFSFLFPYLNTPEVLSTGKYLPEPETRATHIRSAEEACTTSFTSHLERYRMNAQETRLADSIEHVLGKICSFAGSVLEEAVSLDIRLADASANSRDVLHIVDTWKRRLSDLMDELNWASWHACKGGCADDVSAWFSHDPVADDLTNAMRR